MRFKNKMSSWIAFDLGIFIFYCFCFLYQISRDDQGGCWLPQSLCRSSLTEKE